MRGPETELNDDELARELRAMRPEIDPDFGRKLDEWAAAGFPKREAEQRRFPRPRRRARGAFRVALPRLAGAAALLVFLAVSVTAIQNLGGQSQEDSGGTDEAAVENETLDSGPAAGSSAKGDSGGRTPAMIEPAPDVVPPVPPVRQEPLKPGQEREVQRDASMRLSTEPDQVDEVADGVNEVTERYGGIVLSSDVDTRADRGRASFDLRIPAQNLQAALADLSDLATVSDRSEGTVDVTAPFISAEERFTDAKAEADALVERLGEATSADEIAEIRERLSAARAELAGARADLAELKRTTDYARVAVTVTGDGDADGWSLGDAADDAGSVLEDLLGATLVALAVIVPLGLIAAVIWFGVGAARRRARDRALDD
jgi:Domain of unknown function (DUF4349)